MGLGLSVLIAVKATAWFLLFVFFRRFGFKVLAVPFLYASLISYLVSIASHPSINLPMILGKNPDGTFPIWSKIMFFPYLYFVRAFSMLRRFVSGEEPYSQICEGVYVGGWPSSPSLLPPGNPAIVDCTSEFPRIMELKGHSYLCVPTWDTRAPEPGQIELAVKWACRKRAQNKPVFIHCAYGHGRSVAVTCALLVALGVAEDWRRAEKYIRERRPYIKMNSLHHKALEEWSKHRLSSPKRNE
ncbi:hypothetical protein QUC31_002365 [Theobroma cacao]|uniref:Phosphotyrosine protein phosphatases superfamily protein n=2 Tax=Theobroma cacao TaxID=3641 RepID=A0A061F8E4_THECC|nr:PREDICTED: uncharacterized protein YnbD [Theobroma cacao]EOY13620.1 Phosphotyrosine protein phosphatases superfamily protein [Theobroma cacao]